MRLMRVMPICQKPNTSKPAMGHKTYPCLLAGLRIDRLKQVWCANITCWPMRKGFLDLVAIRCPAAVCQKTARGMDWFIHKALNEAIHKFGPPEIMNTSQGSQLTSFDWTTA